MWGIPGIPSTGKQPKITNASAPRRKYIVTALRGDLSKEELDVLVVDLLSSAGLSGLTISAFEPDKNTFTKLKGH